MPSMLDRLRAVLKKPETATDALAIALDDARGAEADALAAVERQAATVAVNYLDDEAKRAKDRAVLADLRDKASDAVAIRAELERRHAAALAVGEQGRRQAIYVAAQAQADAAALALAKNYTKLAADMVALLKGLATAQAAVISANAALPDGVEAITDPEMVVRGVPGLPREVVSDVEVELWGRFDLNEPVDSAYQDEIYECGNGWGKRGAYEGGPQSMGEPQAVYRLRRFRKITYREATAGDYPLPLAAALQLPAVRGSGVLWGERFPVFDSGLAMAVTGQGLPDAVLARVAEAEAVRDAKPVKVERPLRVEWPSFAEVVFLPAQKPTPDTVSRRAASARAVTMGSSPFSLPAPNRPTSGRSAGGRR